jgi:NAD(P)-dependent dehydrogenase (short-subunit alcohol dehydrogenase family)
MMASSQFNGKSVLVVGASGAIGREMVNAFAKRGAIVHAADQQLPVDLAGDFVRPVILDIRDDASVDRLFSQLASAGGLDILFNGAGIHSAQAWGSRDRVDIEEVMRVNFVGAVMILQAAASLMARRGAGSIVNVASIAGRVGGMAAAYGASKAALISATQSAARAYAASGIRVNAIAPGPVRSEMWIRIQETMAGGASRSGFDAEVAGRLLLGRIADPLDLVATTLLLASAEASHITGQTINIDGGMVLN